jgi:uncharacterized membrane protein
MATRAAPPIDNRPWVRNAVLLLAAALLATCLFGLFRWLTGLAPPTPWVHRPALAIHMATIIPAIPLGAYVLFVKKGGPRHRLLGRIWLGLMLTSALATIFIKNLNQGHFSWIHLLTLLTLLMVPRAYLAARRRDFATHRKVVLGLYVSALLIAGLFTFLPGRTMWQWAFG